MSFPVLVEYSAKPNRPFQALPDSLVLTWKYTALVTIADPSGVTAGSCSDDGYLEGASRTA